LTCTGRQKSFALEGAFLVEVERPGKLWQGNLLPGSQESLTREDLAAFLASPLRDVFQDRFRQLTWEEVLSKNLAAECKIPLSDALSQVLESEGLSWAGLTELRIVEDREPFKGFVTLGTPRKNPQDTTIPTWYSLSACPVMWVGRGEVDVQLLDRTNQIHRWHARILRKEQGFYLDLAHMNEQGVVDPSGGERTVSFKAPGRERWTHLASPGLSGIEAHQQVLLKPGMELNFQDSCHLEVLGIGSEDNPEDSLLLGYSKLHPSQEDRMNWRRSLLLGKQPLPWGRGRNGRFAMGPDIEGDPLGQVTGTAEGITLTANDGEEWRLSEVKEKMLRTLAGVPLEVVVTKDCPPCRQ
jgi:hypothetical protein